MKQSAFISALKFVSHAKAKNDVRYYLNAVHFEFKSGVLTMVATDGHRMAWAEVQAPDMPDATYLLNGADIDTLLKVFKANSTGDIGLWDTEHRLEFRAAGQGVSCAKVDGRFPDWRRVASPPAGPIPAYKDVNYEYLAQAAAAFKGLTGKWGRVTVHMNPEMQAMRLSAPSISVDGVLTAQCIIMPMRADQK